jgi:hypothetical protein
MFTREAHTDFCAGAAAYFDSAAGMIPGKVTAVLEPGLGTVCTQGKVRFEVTRKYGPYRPGEVLEVRAYRAVPRRHLMLGRAKLAINTLFAWVN